jgi:serine/threonine-protein kinase
MSNTNEARAKPQPQEHSADPVLLYQQRCKSGQAPDLSAFLSQLGTLSSDDLCALVRADQEFRWTRGQSALAEDYLRRFPGLRDSTEVALDLIYSEFVLRRRLGHNPTIAEYLGRFPELADRLRTQLELDQALGTETLSELDPNRPIPGPPASASPATTPYQADTPRLNGTPRRIGQYEVLGELGRGTFGVVYRARDTRLARQVAIKVMHAAISSSADELARFRAEVEALGSLQHPNIVQIHDTGIHEGMPYLVMELIEGGNLAQQLNGQPRPCRDAAALVEVVARATHVAHQKGIVHRDLKPGNIMLTGDGTPKITDFGLVKRLDRSLGLSQTGQAIGTPSYMAPEQASGRVHEVGPAADVYALGAILYELLTGRPPFLGPDVLAVLDQVRAVEPLSPSRLVPRLPRDLCTICLKCLEKEPRRRYASALDLADDLRRFLDGHTIVARPAGFLERAWRLVRRRPWEVSLVVASVLMIILVVVWIARERVLEERRKQEVAVVNLEARKEEEKRQFMEQEHEHSLDALNGILDLVVKGKLQNKPGLEPLHDELLRHYKALIDRQQGSDLAPREKLVDACLRLGKLIRKTGKLTDAHGALDRAEQLSQGLIKHRTQEPRLAHQLSRVLLERGRIHEEMGLTAKAQKDYQAARECLERLHKGDPGNPEYQRDLGEVLHLLAGLSANADTATAHKEALALYHRALELRKAAERRADAKPEDRADLARTYGYLGDLLLDMGQLADADVAYWRSQHIREQLASANDSDPDEANFQLARGYANFSGYQTRTGALATAAFFLDKSLDLRKKLVRENPGVTVYQTDLAGARISRAELLLHMRKEAGPDWRRRALDLAQEADRIYQQQREQKKGNEDAPGIQLGLVQAHTLRARLLADDRPSEGKVMGILGEAGKMADNLLKGRGEAEALPRAIMIEALYQRAMIDALLAELVARRPVATDTKSLRENALKELEQAYQKGFGRIHPDNVRRERAFQSLRDQPEFQKILSGLPAAGQAANRSGGSVP